MSMYCYWTRTQKLSSGDVAVIRMDNDNQEIARVVIPACELDFISRQLVRHSLDYEDALKDVPPPKIGMMESANRSVTR